jgi:uncharacterized protein
MKGLPMRSKVKVSRCFALSVGSALAVWTAASLPAVGVLGTGTPMSVAQAPRRADATQGKPIKVLFLVQDDAQAQQPPRPHSAAAIHAVIGAPLARRGIQLSPVLTPQDALVPETIKHYDALMIYGDHTTITPDQEKALVDFVEGGKGVVALHSAAGMFANSERYASLIGAQGKTEGGGEFTAEIVQPAHPVTQGGKPFSTWDETIVFTKQNPADRTVLMERASGGARQPWTWVRTQGKGRVFYTAYGHDQRTWTNPEFQTLVERAIVWAVDEPARQAWQQYKMPSVAFAEGFIVVPNYEQRTPAPKYQLPFTVEDSMKFIQAPAEFTVELFAAEPDIVKPITFSFDERGRMWIAETVDYPNEALNGQPGDDRIRILEDTNGDGRADKFTLFADRLNIPTSLVFANGGVIVSQPPHFLFLKDTDGDDKADVREVLFTGWGIRDTHAVSSNLQYGLDNFIWGVVGYSGFQGEINGKKFQFNQAAYRFRPDGKDFEVMTGSTNNTWGLGFSETFDVFGSTANNDPSWYMAIPNRFFDGIEGLPATAGRGTVGPGYQSSAAFYAVHPLTPYIRQVDVFGGYTAGAGHYLYTARSFPKQYWNRIALINEPTAHLLGLGIMEKQGAGFVTRDGWNLMAGAEEWFAPVHAQVGPDGAVWVADWYNFIIQHNPTPQGFSNGPGNAYETSLRDHERGRIYRVSYKNAPPAPKRSLSKNDTAGLLSALASDNMFWRLTAQRLLVERAQKDVVPQLLALVRNTSVDAVGINGGATHALWTLKGLGELEAPGTQAYEAAVAALKHPAAGVRKAAAMVLPKTAQAATAILKSGALQDSDLHTRLAVALVVSEMPESAEIGQALYRESQKAENYGDKWLSRAFYIAASRHRASFVTAYKADRAALPFESLPVSLRMGTLKPDWRAPSARDLTAEWKEMQVPGNWESRGLPDFDGVVWFTRTVDIGQSPGAGSLSLGAVRNTAEVWINGLLISAPSGRGAPGGGRGNMPAYDVPAGTLRPGANQITVRIQNNRNDGGFVGTADAMFLQVGDNKVAIAGPWKYRVERQTNVGAFYTRPGELAAHVAFTAAGGLSGAAGAALKPVAPQAPDVVLRIAAVPGQLKFDLAELTVTAGQLVEVVFANPDAMQHNFVLGAQGSLEQIGAAADTLAQSPAGLAQQYIPEIPQVLFSTKLIEPGQTSTFQFRAPSDPGKYPYVCTFPAHWRVMNGVLNVLQPQGRGGRGLRP